MSINYEKDLKKYNIDEIIEDPFNFANEVSSSQGIKFLKIANHYYYGTAKPLISDSIYDKIEEILKERFPKNKFWDEIRKDEAKDDGKDDGKDKKEKVKLPYWMGSMDKIKRSKEQIEKWLSKFNGNYLISEKLDGMSCLLTIPRNIKEKDKENRMKLYSRGDGSIGQDISNLLEYLPISSLISSNKIKIQPINELTIKNKVDLSHPLAFRGELIISRDKYDSKYKDIKTDPRSMVAGIMNSKNPNIEEIKDLELVIYEIINPSEILPSNQFKLLNDNGFKTPRHQVFKKLDEDILIKTLDNWKKESLYEIDGLIITQDISQPRNTEGNPEYSKAFKMDLDEQRGIGEIEEIIWEISRHGKIIPRIKIKPIKIGLVTIQKATAFNAKYIVDNKLGKGAVVNIIRSGDVIPYIESVVKPSKLDIKEIMPDFKYKWHPSGYDIYVDETNSNKTKTDEIEIKKLTYFMTTLEAEGISGSTISRYYNAGYKTIKDILEMKLEDLLKLPNTQDKLARKQLKVLQEIKTKKHSLDKLMVASGVFGLGLGTKKLLMILEHYPDVLNNIDNISNITKSKIIEINGFEEKTAELFMNGLDKFKKWLKEYQLNYYIPKNKSNDKIETGTQTQTHSQSLPLNNIKIVMTGFRDKELKEKIEKLGGIVDDTLTSKTNILIAKDLTEKSKKIEKAESLGIIIISVEDFKNKYKL